MNEFSEDDRRFMQLALEMAKRAEQRHEVPVGAVVAQDGSVVATGFNQPIATHDPTAHAEIQALRAACKAEGNYRLPEASLYLTLEPCAMCAGAIVHARIKKVIIATAEPRAGAGGSVLNLLQHPMLNHQCQIVYGLFAEESAQLLKSFFKSRR